MKWSEVRKHFPEGCFLVEVLKSDTRGKERAIEERSVIDGLENGNAAGGYGDGNKKEFTSLGRGQKTMPVE